MMAAASKPIAFNMKFQYFLQCLSLAAVLSNGIFNVESVNIKTTVNNDMRH